MATIRQTFFQECEEQLAELEAGLVEMNKGGVDSETLNAVFRAVHSIKGGGGAFGFDDLVRFAHMFENTLDEIRAGLLAPTAQVMKVALRGADVLADLVAAAQEGRTLEGAAWLPVLAEFQSLGGEPDADSDETVAEIASALFQPAPMSLDFDSLKAPSPRSFTIRFKPKRQLYANANEAAILLRELARLGEMTVECDASALPLLDELDPDGAYFAWTIILVT